MTPEEKRNELLGSTVVKALQRRHYQAAYVPDEQQAVKLALTMIPKGDSVSWGGSMSIRDSGLVDAIKAAGCYAVLDRDNAAPGEDIARKALLCDTYLMSANAMSEDGQIVNIDGNGNRIAAMIFGPKSVIMLVGVNKIVRTADDALTRARTVAAPINVCRFDKKTPCAVTGVCGDCTGEDSICSHIVTTRLCKPAGRIKVIIVGKTLGY